MRVVTYLFIMLFHVSGVNTQYTCVAGEYYIKYSSGTGCNNCPSSKYCLGGITPNAYASTPVENAIACGCYWSWGDGFIKCKTQCCKPGYFLNSSVCVPITSDMYCPDQNIITTIWDYSIIPNKADNYCSKAVVCKTCTGKHVIRNCSTGSYGSIEDTLPVGGGSDTVFGGCLDGYESDSSTGDCVLCPAGQCCSDYVSTHFYYSLGYEIFNTLSICLIMFTIDGCQPCPTGTYSTGGAQCSSPTTGKSACFCREGSLDACTAQCCDPGTVVEWPNLCRSIPTDHYCSRLIPTIWNHSIQFYCDDGSVAECTTCDNLGYQKNSDCTTYSDMQCDYCKCGEGFWNKQSCGGGSIAWCKECTTCGSGKYRSTDCTATSDANCTTCDVCPSHTSESKTYAYGCEDGIGNTQCLNCDTGCLLTQYVSSPCSTTSNRGCATCVGCGAGYRVNSTVSGDCEEAGKTPKVCHHCEAGSYSSEHNSASCMTCDFGTYAPTIASSACKAWTPPVLGKTYVMTPGNTFMDNFLQNCTSECPNGKFLNGSCDLMSDIKCDVCTICREGTFEISDCNNTNDRVCDDCVGTICEVGSYQNGTCDNGNPPSCVNCSHPCSKDSWMSRTCGGGDDLKCTACNNSNVSGHYKSSECSESHDTIFTKCTVCSSIPGKYENESCQEYEDTFCADCKECSLGEYAQTTCGATQDTSCSQCQTCMNWEFETMKCTDTTNRMCQNCTDCETGSYQTSSCNSTSNTICKNCGSCIPGEEYLLSQCTSFEGVRCGACSSCEADEFNSTVCDGILNNVCSKCRSCLAGEYEVSSCTSSRDRVCSACSTCSDGTFETSACTSLENRICSPCRNGCPKLEYIGNGCNSTHDAVCLPCIYGIDSTPCGMLTHVP